MRIFVVEDDTLNLEITKSVIEQCDHNMCGYAINYNEAVEKINKLQPDVILIDITLPGNKNGIDLGNWLNKHLEIPHIYLTSHNNKSIIEDAVTTGPVNYIVKPIEKSTLISSLGLIKANPLRYKTHENEKDYIFIKNNGNSKKFYYDDIYYCYSDEHPNYSNICIFNKSEIKIRESLKSLLELFNNKLIRIHRSYLINPNKIREINGDSIILKNGVKLPIGRKYKKIIAETLDL